MQNIFATLLAGLDQDGLTALAAELERTAKEARRRAFEIEQRTRVERQRLERRQYIDDAGEMVGRLIFGGLDEARALDAARRQTGLDVDELRHAFRRFLQSRSENARAARRIMVGRLAARGWSNRRIAAEVGCHENTVSRDVGEIFRRGRQRHQRECCGGDD